MIPEYNEKEIKMRLAKTHRHFAWRIMVYLKSNPDVLSENNNQEIFDEVREIQIQYHYRKKAECSYEDAVELVDLLCELEAKKYGAEYYVSQNEMELYRPGIEHDKEWQLKFYITLMTYDDGAYTKEVHELVLAEEEAERNKDQNITND